MRPWQIAVMRAAGGGTLYGLAAFLAIWAQTGDVKLLITAFGTPFLSTIIVRGVAEGWWDTIKS